MATINLNITRDDVVSINVQGNDAGQNESVTIDKDLREETYKRLEKDLCQYNHEMYENEHKHWWYEVWADFGESFDDVIYPKIKDMSHDEQYTFCLGYMWERDGYYFSPAHYEFLNKMVKEIDNK